MGLQLIQNWRYLVFRRFSTWLAMLNGVFVAYVFSQPVLVIGLIGFSPDGWMLPLAIGAGFFAFVLPVITAHIAQPKANAKAEAKAEAKAAEKLNADQPD